MADELFDVSDQIVLVSGGSRGIGKALAKGFAERGAQVVITGREKDSLESAANEISTGTCHVQTVVCDVSETSQIEKAVDQVIEDCGKIDTLLNVAGVNIRQPAVDFSAEEFDFVLDINLRGAFFMAQQVGRHLVDRGTGSVLNIDSLNSHSPLTNVTPYAMSKCGLSGMTQVLAREWGPAGVRVNGLAPGFILTDLTQQLWSDPTMQEWGHFNTPLGRLGQPDDLVGTAIFLSSPAAAWLTGQTIYVDGGFSSGRNWPIPGDGGQSR